MKTKLKLSDVRKPMSINFERNPSLYYPSSLQKNYVLDYDIKLSNNKPLQRKFVWTITQKSELILSVLKGKSIGNVHFIIGGYDDRVISILDGKQRVSTIMDFMDDKFAIEYCGYYYKFSDLDSDAQRAIQKYELFAYVAYEKLDTNKCTIAFPDKDLIDAFYMLNYSGTFEDVNHIEDLYESIKKENE